MEEDNSIYVIVHEQAIPRGLPQREKIERLLKEFPEKCFAGKPVVSIMFWTRHGQSCIDPESTFFPKLNEIPGKLVRVCGAYRGLCVAGAFNQLQRNGYKVILEEDAIISDYVSQK